MGVGGRPWAICQFLAELGSKILPVHSLILSVFLDLFPFLCQSLCVSIMLYQSIVTSEIIRNTNLVFAPVPDTEFVRPFEVSQGVKGASFVIIISSF